MSHRVVDARQLEDGRRVENDRVDPSEGLEQHQHDAYHHGPAVRANLDTCGVGRRNNSGGGGMRDRRRSGGKEVGREEARDTRVAKTRRGKAQQTHLVHMCGNGLHSTVSALTASRDPKACTPYVQRVEAGRSLSPKLQNELDNS